MKLRDESTPEGRKIWADVDLAASRAPNWVKQAMGVFPDGRSMTAEERDAHRAIKQRLYTKVDVN